MRHRLDRRPHGAGGLSARLGQALLEPGVVAAGQRASAWVDLRQHARELASARYGVGLDGLRDFLRAQQRTLTAQPDGYAAARAEQRERAIRAYRERVRARGEKLDLRPLGASLPLIPLARRPGVGGRRARRRTADHQRRRQRGAAQLAAGRSRGELDVDYAHPGVLALAVVEHDGAPLIISASYDGALRSWRVGPRAWASLGGPLAAQLEVRHLSLGSLELEVLVPTAVSALPPALGFVLYAIRRLWTFPIQLKIDSAKKRAELIKAEHELALLAASDELDDVVEAARDAVIEAWNVIDAMLSDDEDDVG